MIKNEYLETYLVNPKNLSEFEKELLSHDDNRLINMQRPLSQRSIIRLPKKIFKKFAEDIMTNEKVNKLLYSGIARKVSAFNNRQSNFVAKATKFYFKGDPFSSRLKNSQNLFFKKKKAEMYEIIKKNILETKK